MPLFSTRSLRSVHAPRSIRSRATLALAGSALALVGLVGCAPEAGAPTATGTGKPTASPTPGSTSEPTATESATPSPTPTPKPVGTPVALDCNQVLTPDDVYAFNPNYGTAPNYEPSDGSAAETAVSYEGVACGWLNQTNEEIIEVSVVQPNDVLMTQLKDAAIASSNPVPTYGTPPEIEGFFSNAGGTGEAQVFTPKYWVAVTSPVFFEPGDVQNLVAAVVSHLP